MDGNSSIDSTRSDFIEKMGIVAQGEGLPRISGQIFAALVFDGGPIAFGELAETLQVSRASISTSIRLLQERGLVKRVNKRGERQDYFQLAENAYATMLQGARSRTIQAKAEIDETIAALPTGAADIRRRLTDYAGFYGAVQEALHQAVSKISNPKA